MGEYYRLLLFLLFFFLNFGNRVLLCSSGWPRTCYTDFRLKVKLLNVEVTGIYQHVQLQQLSRKAELEESKQ